MAGPPRLVPDQRGQRGHEEHRHDERRQHDAERDREAHLLQERDRREHQHPERAGEDQSGRGDRRAGVLDADRGRLARLVALPRLLAQPGDHQDVVVGPDRHHEQVQDDRQLEGDTGLALQALEEIDRGAQRGGEVEQHRDHEVDRRDQAAQQQREDERDQHRRHRQDHRQVPVVRRVDVREDRGRPADHRPRARRRGRVQGVAQIARGRA